MEGEGLRLKEYYVTNEKIAGPGESNVMRLSERDFMVTDLTTNTMAIAMDKLNIKKDETAQIVHCGVNGRERNQCQLKIRQRSILTP